jgi:hypothetical protein
MTLPTNNAKPHCINGKAIAVTHRPLPALHNDSPEWLRLLINDVSHTGSIAATARRIGIDRSALSGFLNGTSTSPYINGTASTKRLEAKVLATIGQMVCPFLSQEYGEDRHLTGLECRSYALIPHPPTHSPRAMQHWRACQSCGNKPAAMRMVEVKPIKTTDVQQAGVIDTVTRPLPEVGAPQVDLAALQGETA